MSEYTVYVTPDALHDMKDLPGKVRQRVRRAVSDLASEPRPSPSKPLDVEGVSWEPRRLRIDRWRIIYVISEAEKIVDVLAIRKRPPYDYGDLDSLLKDFHST